MKLLVTGGAGFIGSAFVRLAIQERWAARVINYDALTYAGNLENLTAVQDDPAYRFVRGDVTDSAAVNSILQEEQPDAIVHFAAESHVDRSILGPRAFFETNLRGTFTMLEAARAAGIRRFIHISTDEVYGSIEAPNKADENYPLHTSSPYSASKAGSDLLALSYYTTYKLPVLVTRASNNYGPYHFPEKLIPLMIANAMEDRPLPIYGDGLQIREWLWVEDHCGGIRSLLDAGDPGEVYNIGAACAHTNKEVVERILTILGKPLTLMTRVTDRPGHDRRYAISSEKIRRATGWEPSVSFEDGLARTIDWYRNNTEWTTRVRSGEYLSYYRNNYEARAQV